MLDAAAVLNNYSGEIFFAIKKSLSLFIVSLSIVSSPVVSVYYPVSANTLAS